MTGDDPILTLEVLSRGFGPREAREKLRLLKQIGKGRQRGKRGMAKHGTRSLKSLHDTLCFMRAYPDDRQVLAAVLDLGDRLRGWVQDCTGPAGSGSSRLSNTGVPGSTNRYPYSYAVLRQMLQLPCISDCLEIDWEELEEEAALHNALVLLVGNNECQGLDDIRMTLSEWCSHCKGDLGSADHAGSDLQFILGLFAGSSLGAEEQAFIYDSCMLPIRYELAAAGTGRVELCWPQPRIHYQKQPIPRDKTPLQPRIRRPFSHVRLSSVARGREVIGLSLRALCSRNLEISSLMYANSADVTVLACGRGLQVALVGVVPEYRDALEISYFCLILKNGVPIAYGPASVCLGCCEMGINLFPEFRGGEIRYIYSQFMRSLHQVLGVRYFYLTSYGMGEGNPEAIRTGAFWFYRKLGFRAENVEVEALALAEEEKMRAQPGYRSSRQTLRRMSHTDVYFDISGGACRRLDLGRIGMQQSRLVQVEFGGDRKKAEKHWVRRAARLLGCEGHAAWPPAAQRALKILAPVFCMLPDLAAWKASELGQMRRILKEKGSRSEAGVDKLIMAHVCLREGLRQLARPSPQ